MKKIIVLIVMLLLVSGCSSKEDKVVYNSDTNVIYTSVGKSFTFELLSTPASNYSWEFVIDPSFSVLEDIFVEDETLKNYDGASGLQRITFKSNQRGSYEVVFNYSHAQDDTLILQTFKTKINVE